MEEVEEDRSGRGVGAERTGAAEAVVGTRGDEEEE